MATAQQLVRVSCEDRKKKNITRSPSSPGDTVRCCIRKARGRAKKWTRARKHARSTCTRTHTLCSHTQSHAPLHPAAAPPATSLPLSRQNIYSTWNLPRNRGETSALPWLAELPSNRVCLTSQSGALWEAHWPNETDYSEARGRHSDLVTVRRRSQGDAGGREEKLSAIGS